MEWLKLHKKGRGVQYHSLFYISTTKKERYYTIEIQVFRNELGAIRVIGNYNNPLFCLNDVCKALDLSTPSKIKSAILREFEGYELDSYPLKTNGGIQNFTMITEPQLYFVLMRSDKPKAKPFRRWVTSEVLPSIRKNGHYETQAYKAYQRDSLDEMIQAIKSISSERDKAKEESLKIKEQSESLKDELIAKQRELLEFYKNQTQKPSILQNRFLTESEKQKIRELHRKGLSYYAIGKALNRDHCTISRFIKRDSLFGDFTKKTFKKSPNQGGLL